MDKRLIINSLIKLCEIDSISTDEINQLKFDFEPINTYIEHLQMRVKPETAATQLIHGLINELFGGKIVPEVNLKGDFIDFIVKENNKIGNPICIELKPLFKYSSNKNTLRQDELKFQNHKDQIQKYLKNQGIEYVVLTNINKAYIFNRSAIIDYKPFFETTLSEILANYIINENLWDTVRRFEDDRIEYNLDEAFFQDLKKWFAQFDNVIFKKHPKLSEEEIKVLFLNKFIFIKTLEDYGLIPYRHIQDEYEYFLDKWIAKGNDLVFKYFFNNMEDFFEIYYDTELFTSNFWDFVDSEDELNVNRFQSAFESVLGLDNWSNAFGKGIVHYNYRKINEDIFGKAYETWIAENRKDEGIFYTPATITEFMANDLVDTLFDDLINELVEEIKSSSPVEDKINDLLKQVENIKIIDSTSGSGSFMIKVLRAVYNKYQILNDNTKWVSNINSTDLFSVPDNVRYIDNLRKQLHFTSGDELVLISKIILNHIFAADRDERAIDTAKTNIWKEAVKLNPGLYNFRRLDNKKIHILPNLEMNFIKGDSLTDYEFELQVDIITNEFKDDIAKLFEIRNSYLSNPYKPDVIAPALLIKDKIKNRLIEQNPEFKDSLFYPLEFFFCYFESDGSPLPKQLWGFDGIISNPPWEAIKPIKKEFARQDKYDMDILQFNQWFDNELISNTDFKNKWNKYIDRYEQYNNYLYGKYKHQSNGDPNYYKFFLERDLQLIKDNAYYCLLVPSGFQTDDGGDKLRELIINDNTIKQLYSFENRGYYQENDTKKTKLFPEVDNRFKFSIVFAQKIKSEPNYNFKAKFYLHAPKDLYNGNTIIYNIEKIKQFSPDNLSIMEFRSEKDYEVCLKIKDDFNLDASRYINFRAELHMTNDSHLFNNMIDVTKQKKVPFLRLFEGKMIHQFTSSYGQAKYFIKEAEARTELLRKVKSRIKSDNKLGNEEFEKIEIPDNILLDYQTYRLVYRAIASSTNERTLISSIVPPKVFIGHSMNHSVNIDYKLIDNTIEIIQKDKSELVFIMSLLNSLTLNYYIRNKISANLTMNFIYELPIANANSEQTQRIIELGFSLLYRKSNKADYEDLKQELNICIDNRDEEIIRAELEVLIARDLYQLTKEQWEYICSTFTFGKGDSRAELDEIIRLSKEIY